MQNELSLEEKEFRLNAVQAAVDNNRLEGMIVDEDAMQLFSAWIENKLTFDEVEQAIYKICGPRLLH